MSVSKNRKKNKNNKPSSCVIALYSVDPMSLKRSNVKKFFLKKNASGKHEDISCVRYSCVVFNNNKRKINYSGRRGGFSYNIIYSIMTIIRRQRSRHQSTAMITTRRLFTRLTEYTVLWYYVITANDDDDDDMIVL
jgi:hypothetical protein